MAQHDRPMWAPKPEHVARSAMTCFARQVALRHGACVADYAGLHRWSVEHRAEFWGAVWDFCEVIGQRGESVLESRDAMPGAKWFPEARLNFAENLLRRRDSVDAIVFRGEDRVERRMSFGQLHAAVAQCAAALRAHGVGRGDRVAAWMPNMPETVVLMLASASVGAVFTSASPDFGVRGVLDRFGQTQPKLLVAADGYFYNRKHIATLARLAEVVRALPSVERVVVVPYAGPAEALDGVRGAQSWDTFVAPHRDVREIAFEQLPFDHPLYILYSSGTTGVPKCIVHGAGGTLLQHLKEHRLHCDLRAGDRLFYFTTCGWMMWNWLVSALASGVTLLLYDGAPTLDDGAALFDYADAEGMTHLGTSAKFIDAIAKAGLSPRRTHRLDALRMLLSTGSPLVPEGFDYVYREIKADLCLASISGGTDIVSCFVLGNPDLPVWRGEIQCAGLGMAVDVVDEAGKPLAQGKGELVCRASFPSMPTGFWNDADGSRYHKAYFERFPGLWCHGDFCERTAHVGFVIHGRSDATLNPGGVRIGTAEIYRQVEQLDEVLESVAIGQDWPPDRPVDVRVVLFVRLRDGVVLDDALIARIREAVRANTTPRHVPARIVQVAEIPRTRSGKLVELAVRRVVHGEPVDNFEALANPEALAHFRDRPELRT
ncbi:acetoacetate--CoA ligase [Pseudazoarcus pumilus]|uniref:Acetoacetate--CoA ligase n=1 Tax=Pseudazoarcus pumilus TaxID=2067960 RepID=A0A2I6S757_9RHOO|nr:acetoacetate--CoA ligase [Pseudazoarcus pumilus]AUN95093.1 acetoacetate--CoA ligase [Pseudazoarcus pumilus]